MLSIVNFPRRVFFAYPVIQGVRDNPHSVNKALRAVGEGARFPGEVMDWPIFEKERGTLTSYV